MRLAIGIMLCLFILTGCTHEKTIEDEEYIQWFDGIQGKYQDIEAYDINFVPGPDTLTIDFKCNMDMSVIEIGKCFEEVKEFLLRRGMLDRLDIKSEQYYGIKEIAVNFRDTDTRIEYISNYYKDGPNGYQDNRYWTEENVDGFETWTIHEYEIGD